MASFAFHDSVLRPYLVFVTTQASLLVKKANEILESTNVGGSKLPFSEAPFILTSACHVMRVHGFTYCACTSERRFAFHSIM